MNTAVHQIEYLCRLPGHLTLPHRSVLIKKGSLAYLMFNEASNIYVTCEMMQPAVDPAFKADTRLTELSRR